MLKHVTPRSLGPAPGSRKETRMTEKEALTALLRVVQSHRAYTVCGHWLVVHVDLWFIVIEIARRWEMGIDRAGWRSRPFWGRVQE